jgi:hypothetical protein
MSQRQSQIIRSPSRSNYRKRTFKSPRTEKENLTLADLYDKKGRELVGETNLLMSFIYARKGDINHNVPWKESIKEFIKYHPKLREDQKALLNTFENLEEIQKRIDSNRDTIPRAVGISHSLRFTVKPTGGKKYRKHKTSKHKTSKHKSSKHKSSKHKSSKHKSSKHKSRK